ncbi:sulfatase-like hydrolase/transferase [Maribellus comscasis]|uniref:Sulfatase-like hydrolase/transferase n=1 Tax=Maribellus comscasis TaxID=2681766 RepID=A0A6I6JNJ2_9BACT|nr:sulfatase [Maribellus comscasis]QGY42550.1 sulfatase-like hydrolase/transferase [Maribellus comscasis]
MSFGNKSKLLFFISCVIGCFSCSTQIPKKQDKPPNIVLIFVDDMGYGDLGCYGATQYQTPNLDKIASQGIRFTNFYAAQPVCSASRAALLTGCYPNRVGIHGALKPNSNIGLNPDEETIAEVLKKQNYKTAAIGKWHLGDLRQFLPLQQGFDEYLGIPYSNNMWPVYDDNTRNFPERSKWKEKYPELPLIKGNQKIGEFKNNEDQEILTTLYTQTAIEFINSNKEVPFFLYLAHSMPHIPLAVSEKFKGKSEQGIYGDVVMEIDWSVGQVLKTLEECGLSNNTLVIFASDNGPWLSYGNFGGSAGGLREGKGTTYEGGQRVPCLMKWPGVIPEGIICNKLASAIDILPTLASISDVPLPSKKIDGVNIISLMKGEKDANPRNSLYYYYRENSLEAVRKDNWKLVLPHVFWSYEGMKPGQNGLRGPVKRWDAKLALYDMRRDPGERYDVKELFPDVVDDLLELAEKAREDLGDDITGREGENRRQPGIVKE